MSNIIIFARPEIGVSRHILIIAARGAGYTTAADEAVYAAKLAFHIYAKITNIGIAVADEKEQDHSSS